MGGVIPTCVCAGTCCSPPTALRPLHATRLQLLQTLLLLLQASGREAVMHGARILAVRALNTLPPPPFCNPAENGREGELLVGDQTHRVHVLDLPTVVETYKTYNDENLVKSGDIGQVRERVKEVFVCSCVCVCAYVCMCVVVCVHVHVCVQSGPGGLGGGLTCALSSVRADAIDPWHQNTCSCTGADAPRGRHHRAGAD